MYIMERQINMYLGGNMKNKLSYMFPILFALSLIVVSACRNTSDLSYYYANSTGAGNGNSCCCGCCNNSNSNTDAATPYCEPEAPELVACDDGTITITAYKSLTFATTGDCGTGKYTATKDGVMHLDGTSGRELWNSDNKPLLWIAAGDTVASIATIPDTIESITVLPDGTVLSYINSVATTLGKLVTVELGTLGACEQFLSPTGAIGHSILWCGSRVSVSRRAVCYSKLLCTVGEFVPVTTLALIQVEVPAATYLTLSQDFIQAEANRIYITGIKTLAVRSDGLLIEKTTGLPVLDQDGLEIIIPTIGVTELSVSGSILKINNGTWATLSVASLAKGSTLASITVGNLPSGFKAEAKGAKEATMVEVAQSVGAVAPTEQNVCVDNTLGLF